MRTRSIRLLTILNWEDTEFVVPTYQRSYAWGERECRELWRDIHRAAKDGSPHFMGTFLYTAHGQEGAARRLAIVDGQQRITTTTLILAALEKHLLTSGEAPDSELLANLEARLVHPAALAAKAPERTPRLTLSRRDREALKTIIAAEPGRVVGPANPDDPAASNAFANFALFESLMAEDGFDAATLWKGLQLLEVIGAQLEENDPAQPIFESLNSKGLPLTTADLVRNYLLLAETHDQQTRLYNRYWRDIEGMFQPDPGSLRLDNAIQGWLSVRFRKVRAKGAGEVYSVFKQYMEDEFKGTTEMLLRELRSFCLVWAENYRYHAVKKYKSATAWADGGGSATLTAGYEKKAASNPEYEKRLRADLDAVDASL